MKLEFYRQISKNSQISNLIKICPVGAELLRLGWIDTETDGRTDGQTDRQTDMKLIVAFRSFAKAYKLLLSAWNFASVSEGVLINSPIITLRGVTVTQTMFDRFPWASTVSVKSIPNTGCPGRNVKNFGSVFLTLKYTDITQNTYIQSWTVTEIMAREKCGLLAGSPTVPASWESSACPSFSVVSCYISRSLSLTYIPSGW
jgi:hypothetical protein